MPKGIVNPPVLDVEAVVNEINRSVGEIACDYADFDGFTYTFYGRRIHIAVLNDVIARMTDRAPLVTWNPAGERGRYIYHITFRGRVR